jgi:hypothetical protein
MHNLRLKLCEYRADGSDGAKVKPTPNREDLTRHTERHEFALISVGPEQKPNLMTSPHQTREQVALWTIRII